MICQQVFSILVLAFFLLKCSLESASKSLFFSRFGVEIRPVLELQFLTLFRVVLSRFATQPVQIEL